MQHSIDYFYDKADKASADERKAKHELLKRAQAIREKARNSAYKVLDPDPSKEYIWVRHEDNRIASRRGLGYEIVKSKKMEGPRTAHVASNGTNVRGDLILMSIGKDMHEALKQLPMIEHIEQTSRSMGMFEGFAQEAGVLLRA